MPVPRRYRGSRIPRPRGPSGRSRVPSRRTPAHRGSRPPSLRRLGRPPHRLKPPHRLSPLRRLSRPRSPSRSGSSVSDRAAPNRNRYPSQAISSIPPWTDEPITSGWSTTIYARIPFHSRRFHPHLRARRRTAIQPGIRATTAHRNLPRNNSSQASIYRSPSRHGSWAGRTMQRCNSIRFDRRTPLRFRTYPAPRVRRPSRPRAMPTSRGTHEPRPTRRLRTPYRPNPGTTTAPCPPGSEEPGCSPASGPRWWWRSASA